MTRKIHIIDDVAPEANAMLQALYSRDPRSVLVHLEKVKESGPEKFMANFYVGYGHKSIGDCGTTSIFIEQVSMLAAKAIQDWPLYNGQEASTRYLDMSQQEVLNPLGTPEGEAIQKKWMDFYVEALEVLIADFKARYPLKDGEKESEYNKAIKAKAFDIARGFLPAGATTLLSWHTNLRQAHDHLSWLRHHPLPEIRDIAENILSELGRKYASSFLHKKYDSQEAYYAQSATALAYFNDPSITTYSAKNNLDMEGLLEWKSILETRPKMTEVPLRLREYGNITFTFPLDFGSFRDLQRHRSGTCVMPILTTDYGFYAWYLEQLPRELKDKALRLLEDQSKAIKNLPGDTYTKQYYTAMGYAITCKITLPLPAAVYVAELRSSQHVHPTMRAIAQQMGKSLEEMLPGIALYCDHSEDEWNIKRGAQDIINKEIAK